MCNNVFAGKVREIEGSFWGVISELNFGRYTSRLRGCVVRSGRFVGVEYATCADGMALHVTLSVRCAVALPPSGCFFDQGVTTFWRRGVAYGSPMEIVPAEFSTRSLSSPPCRPRCGPRL
jgi:hypothetical protein